MKFLIVFALISAFAISAYGQDLSCKDLENMAETGVRKMFVAEEGGKLPQNAADLENHCNEGKKLYKTLLEYKKCLKPFPQQIFTTTTQSIGKLIKKNCGDEAGKKNALKLVECAKEQNLAKGHKCAIGSLDALQKISESGDTKAAILPKVCCLAHVSTDCIREKLSKIQCSDPTVKPLEHFEEIMGTISKDAMDIACQDYKTMASCQAKIPNEIKEMKQMVDNGAESLGKRSLIKPLLEIAEKIAN